MPNRYFRTSVAALALVPFGIGACNASTSGVAQVEPSTSQITSSTPESTSSTSTPSTTYPLPPRPRTIRMDGVDPCKLLTQQQLRQFAIDSAPDPSMDTTFHAPTCSFFSYSTGTSMSISAVSTVGIERFEPGKVTGDVVIKTIRGFPAVQIHIRGLPAGQEFCTDTVDVADGQVLDVLFNDDLSKQPLTEQTVCQGANAFADAAMTTLLTR